MDAGSPALRCTGVSTAGGAVRAWRRVCRSPGYRNVFGPWFLPFLTPLTFAVFRDLQAELSRGGSVSQEFLCRSFGSLLWNGEPLSFTCGTWGMYPE